MGRKSEDQKNAEKEMAKFNVNYADRDDVSQRAKAFAGDIVTAAKTIRKGKEVEWLEDLRLWACQNSDAQMYSGRSNLIIPELHNQVETTVGQFMTGLFPNDDYIGCVPVKRTNAEEAKDIKDAVFYELNYKNDLPNLIERYERQKTLYGTAFLKPTFEKIMKTVIMNDEKGYAKPVVVPQFQGVKVNCQDTFHTYIWPETANNVEEAIMTFDESFQYLRDMKASKLYKNLDSIVEVPANYSDYGWVDTIRMSINNLSTAMSYRKNAVLLTECWCDFDIVKDEFVPCVITIANYETVVRVQRNPYWHQSKPHLMGRYIKGPAGEAYGHSLPERLRSLHYMIQDLGNQTMDSLTYSLNPIAIINPGFAGDVNSFKMQPGARWFADPQGVDFKTFPDISNAGFQGMQQVRQMIQQFSDNAPSIAPQLSGKVRSATQSQAVVNEVNMNQKNMIRSDEFDVMSPLCSMTHWLLKQFQSDEYQIVEQGAEKGQWITKTVNPKTLGKDVLFAWRGSEVAAKSAIRNQQLISAYNMAMQTSQAMPGEIDLPELFKVVMYEAFDLKDLNIFIKDREKKTVDPLVENLSLDGGEETPVNPGDDYEAHMEAHIKGYEKAEDSLSKVVYLKHMQKHKMQKEAKDMLEQQKAKIESLQRSMGDVEGQQGPPRPQGNKGQVAQSMQGVMQGMRGTEPNV